MTKEYKIECCIPQNIYDRYKALIGNSGKENTIDELNELLFTDAVKRWIKIAEEIKIRE